jgi:putative hydrolase of HD superfamily
MTQKAGQNSELSLDEDLAASLRQAFLLKEQARTGWLRVGIEAPETVAAHSWGVAFLALALCPPELDRGKALAIALVHDLAEALVGDITPHCGVSKPQKSAMEAAALSEICAGLSNGEDLKALWWEYERGSSPEGRFVKACDKLELGFQSLRYKATSGKLGIEELLESAREGLAAHEHKDLGRLISED